VFITSSGHEYESVLSRSKIINGELPFHHEDVVRTIMHQCYKTRYDSELKHFQLRRKHWDLFKQLFEAVTGYIVEERKPEAKFLGATIDLTNQYDGMGEQADFIMGLTIHKPCETITEKECSDGEKKIIKNFTTMLNSEFTPSILLIDNIEMHVQLSRHATLIEAIERCFPNSQIIFTTHSPLIISKFPKECLFDLGARTDRGEEDWKSKMNKIIENAAIVAGGLDFSDAEKAVAKMPKDQAKVVAKNFIDECYRISIRSLNDL
jgi:predicted ATP-dependent endonuclease of OLD family